MADEQVSQDVAAGSVGIRAAEQGANEAGSDLAKPPSSPKKWMQRIERSKKVRRDMIHAWGINVDYRRGKPFAQQTDNDRVNVNIDWAFTKNKHDQLYSQMPQVYLTEKQDQYAPAVPVFGKELNDRLTRGGLGTAVDECVYDTINAAGFGCAMVVYRRTTQPRLDPSIQLTPEESALYESGQLPGADQLPTIDETVNELYTIDRFSPSDLLWPNEFVGSDFNRADWIGRSGAMLWAEARREFKLTDDVKRKVLGTKNQSDTIRKDTDNLANAEEVVEYDEVFYWAYKFDPNEKYLEKINRIVFVKGLKEPVVHEPWQGQQFLNGSYTGACKFPIQVLTLTYITDDAIPPSDTAIGRPQVDELIESRTQIVLNRKHSQPFRWANIDRIDPMVLESMMRGVYQQIIPVQGDGSRAIGEVARANYPPEDWEFDRAIKSDLQEQWGAGNNQNGIVSTGRRSAAEANIVQGNFQTRIGYERARVASFITNLAEVTGGMLALFGNFEITVSPQDQQRLQTWDRRTIGNKFVYWIRPDSTILLDANQRIDRIMKVLNLVGKSGFVNPKPLIEEVIELSGIDPAKVIVDPKPEEPPKPQMSFRFTGAEDLTNPLVVALLMSNGEPPTPEQLEAAKVLLQNVSGPPKPVQPQQEATPLSSPEQINPQMSISAHRDARPNWGGMNKVMKRTSDMRS